MRNHFGGLQRLRATRSIGDGSSVLSRVSGEGFLWEEPYGALCPTPTQAQRNRNDWDKPSFPRCWCKAYFVLDDVRSK